MKNRYVIWSLFESVFHEEPLFWSNKDGWVTLDHATVFPSTNYNLPAGQDVDWVSYDDAEKLRSEDLARNNFKIRY